MSWGYQGGGGGSGGPRAQTAMVSTSAGVVRTLSRLLGSTSTFSLLAGTNANLTLTGGNQITAAVGIAAGASQVAVVREVNGQRAVEYPLTLTGAVLPPVNTVAPALSSSAAYVGQELTASNGTWSNSPSSYSYQWFWADTVTPISGATSASYTPVTGDLGHTLARNVTATNAGGSTTASSNVSAAVGEWAGPPAPTATFTMTQLAKAYQVYQRTTFTGGDAGKGAGPIPVTISGTTAGTFNLRLSSGGATRGDVKGVWAGGTVAGGATTLNASDIPARAGWVYLDIETAAGWQNGTTPVGMGAQVAMAGQSLAVDMFARAHDTATSIASTGASINANGRVLASWEGGNVAANWTAVTDAAIAANVVNSAGAAEMLDLMVRKLGVNVGLIGNAVGATAIDAWLPGQAHHTELARVIALAGGAFEAFVWFQGHTDAGGNMKYHTYRSKLDTLFADLAGRSSVPFAKVLTAIPNINSGSWGSFFAREQIRRAQADWCAENGGSYVPFSDTGLAGDIIHLTQAGARRAAQHFARALTANDTGPVITSVTKSGLDLICAVSLPAGATALTSAGTPASRMLVMTRDNVAGTALALDAVTPITVGANSFTLKLASDPGDVPLEVWPMAVHAVADGAASGLWDNSDDGDGIARGRQLRFAPAPALRRRAGALSTAGVSFAAGKFGNGRSAGEMITGGPVLTDIPWAGRTLECWVTLNALPGGTQVICGSNGLIGMWMNGANLFYAWSYGGYVSVAHGMTAGNTYHLRTVQRPGNQQREIWVNGVMLGSNSDALGGRDINQPFAIGGYGGSPGSFTFSSGVIDEVALWNRALTAAECAVVPTAPWVGNEAGMQHLWHCADGVDSAA